MKFLYIFICVGTGFILISCVSAPTISYTGSQEVLQDEWIQAREFPELTIVMGDRQEIRAKIVSKKCDSLMLSPFPYWSVDDIKVSIDDIAIIKMIRKDSNTGLIITYSGFAVGWALGGWMHYQNSTYKEDFENWPSSTCMCGVLGGCLGLIPGFLASSVTGEDTFHMYNMSIMSKNKALLSIMGLQ